MDMSEYLKNPLQLQSICRICLIQKDGMKTIFEACLEEMVSRIANVKIQQGDGLPSLICRQCILALSRAYSFKKMCEKNAKILETFVSKEFQDELTAHQRKEESTVIANNAEHLTCSENQECVSVIHMASTSDMNNITIKCEAINETNLASVNFLLPESTLVPVTDVSNMPIQSGEDVFISTVDLCEDTLTLPQSVGKYTCTKCDVSFDHQVDYKHHVSEHPNDKTCETCGKTFPGSYAFKRHLKTHMLVKPHICDICNQGFSESSNLSKHKKKHTGELRNVVGKPHLCSVCGRGFKWATSLSKHSKYHTGKNILSCKHCNRQYVEPRSLEVHMRGHTGERPFKCDICDKSFTQQCNLQKHLRTHTGERPYSCDVCKKGFSQKGYIQIHMRTHTGERPYICDICSKGFMGASALAVHKRVHTGEKPYQCMICDKQFARQESLLAHQSWHNGEKPHKCQLCNKGFNNAGHLQSHMRSHTGEKPYSCSTCQKRFAAKASLKVHSRLHTGEKPYVCWTCGKSFSQRSTLSSHVNIHQEKDNTPTSVQSEMQEIQVVVQHDLIAPGQEQSHIIMDPSKPHILVLKKGQIESIY